MTKKELEDKINKYKDTNINDLNVSELDEITEISIDKRKSSNERLLDFFNKVKNPFAFSFKGKIIQIGFSNSNMTAEECLTNMLSTLYK